MISNWFHEHDKEFNVLQWPSQSPDWNPIPLGYGRMGKLQLEFAPEKSAGLA